MPGTNTRRALQPRCCAAIAAFAVAGTSIGAAGASAQPAFSSTVITVQVVGPAGSPLPGVLVGVHDHRAKQSRLAGETDVNGEVTMTVAHHELTVVVAGDRDHLGALATPTSPRMTVQLARLDTVDRASEKRRFEQAFNEALRLTEWASLAEQITRAVIWAESTADVAVAVMTRVPSGPVISIPTVFEFKLRMADGQLVWILSGSLADAIVSCLGLNRSGVMRHRPATRPRAGNWYTDPRDGIPSTCFSR